MNDINGIFNSTSVFPPDKFYIQIFIKQIETKTYLDQLLITSFVAAHMRLFSKIDTKGSGVYIKRECQKKLRAIHRIISTAYEIDEIAVCSLKAN